MARSEAGALLTEQHRLAQLQVRARALRDFLRLWPIWQGDEETFNEMVAATILLIRAYYGLSADVAGGYFQNFRRAEGVEGEAITRLAGLIDQASVIAGMTATGRNAVRDALRTGRSGEDARTASLVRTSGVVTREVLRGGRGTLLRSVAEDRQALGWARVTDGDPCPFCALLASRGPVYKADTVNFEAHGDCGCTAEPAYRDSEWPGRAREFKALYGQAVSEARAAGELERGTSNDLLNAFRRYLSRESKT
ncbi:MAG: hypothetical protein Q8Q52_04850 [Acidimicrobiia bacterium]|nr:hypothetical protein [Acidimicrobiia bacterium]